MEEFSFEKYSNRYDNLKERYDLSIKMFRNSEDTVEKTIYTASQRSFALEAFAVFEGFIKDFIDETTRAIEVDDSIKNYSYLPRSLFNEMVDYDKITSGKKSRDLVSRVFSKPTATEIKKYLKFLHFSVDKDTNAVNTKVKTGKYISLLLKRDDESDYLSSISLEGYNPNLGREDQTALRFLSDYSTFHRHKIAHESSDIYTNMNFEEFEQNLRWFKFIISKIFDDFSIVYPD